MPLDDCFVITFFFKFQLLLSSNSFAKKRMNECSFDKEQKCSSLRDLIVCLCLRLKDSLFSFRWPLLCFDFLVELSRLIKQQTTRTTSHWIDKLN